jgi:hypothetical protein
MVDATGGLVVDPDRLTSIAKDVDTVTGILTQAAGQPRAAERTPNLLSWETGSVAAEAATSWGTFLGRLRDSVDGTANGMRAAAASYSAADANAARLLDKAR